MAPAPSGPISSRRLETGHGLIVTSPLELVWTVRDQDQSLPSVRAFFFKVLKHQHFFFEYQQFGAVYPGTANALDYDYLGDTGHDTGDDLPENVVVPSLQRIEQLLQRQQLPSGEVRATDVAWDGSGDCLEHRRCLPAGGRGNPALEATGFTIERIHESQTRQAPNNRAIAID